MGNLVLLGWRVLVRKRGSRESRGQREGVLASSSRLLKKLRGLVKKYGLEQRKGTHIQSLLDSVFDEGGMDKRSGILAVE